MNFKTAFALLLYVNVFYFGVYSILELCLLLSKGLTANDARYNAATFINEVFLLAFMVVVECLRLMFGQQLQPVSIILLHRQIHLNIYNQSNLCFQTNFHSKLSIVFRVLVLTLPSVYSVSFFTFWQARVTKLVSLKSRLFSSWNEKRWVYCRILDLELWC